MGKVIDAKVQNIDDFARGVGEAISWARKAVHLRQSELADAADIGIATLQCVEAGKASTNLDNLLIPIARALEIPLLVLIARGLVVAKMNNPDCDIDLGVDDVVAEALNRDWIFRTGQGLHRPPRTFTARDVHGARGSGREASKTNGRAPAH